jgi:serine protease Do
LQVDPEKCVGVGNQTPFLAKGNSDEVKIGSMVIAIGFPYNLPSAPSVGFVSGFDIKCGSHMFMTSHFRAGCRLAPGEGGGPLLNARGQVVGIAVAAHGDDQCYVLPINAARKVVDDILQYGRVQHGWVGLSVSDRQIPAGSTAEGPWQVFVQEIYSNTPAVEAGFRTQDILLTIGTNCVRRSTDVLNRMFLHHWNERIEFTVLRNAETQAITVVVGKRPANEILVSLPPQLPDPRSSSPRLPLLPTSALQH